MMNLIEDENRSIANIYSTEATPSQGSIHKLHTLLRRTTYLLEKLGDELVPEQEHIHEIESRLTNSRFHLAVSSAGAIQA